MEFDFKTMPSRVICILSVLFCTIIGLRLCAPSIVIYSKYGYAGPTWTAQRPAQRQQVQQRIAAIGGWQALRRYPTQRRYHWGRKSDTKRYFRGLQKISCRRRHKGGSSAWKILPDKVIENLRHQPQSSRTDAGLVRLSLAPTIYNLPPLKERPVLCKTHKWVWDGWQSYSLSHR